VSPYHFAARVGAWFALKFIRACRNTGIRIAPPR
jgi:hypothetical protein